MRYMLLVTGSGATAQLGKGGAPVAQMGEWAGSLVDDLEALVPGAAARIGLARGMPADEFERNLGQFLAYERSLETVKRFGQLSCQVAAGDPVAPPNPVCVADFEAWGESAVAHATKIMHTIHSNLYSNFGPGHIDQARAQSAYRTLIERIAEPGHAFAIGTTNYDQSAEMGLHGWQTSTGRPAQARTGIIPPQFETPWLDPAQVTQLEGEWDGQYVVGFPVMHLHGAVGWYLDGDRIIQPSALDQPFDATRRPALLLPDDQKSAASLAGGASLWRVFRRIASHSTHIGFLGHGLNDKHLVDVVNESMTARKAVFWYEAAAGDDLDGKSATHVSDDSRRHIEEACPGSEIILCRFGPDPIFDEPALEGWLASPR